MKCLYCGKPLSRMSLRRDGDFCCREHRESYHLRQGLNRVQEAHEFSMLSRRRECPTAARLDRRPLPGPSARRVCVGDAPAARRKPGERFLPRLGIACPRRLSHPWIGLCGKCGRGVRPSGGWPRTRPRSGRKLALRTAGAADGARNGTDGARRGGVSSLAGPAASARGSAARDGVARGKRGIRNRRFGRRLPARVRRAGGARWLRRCGCADGRPGVHRRGEILTRPVSLRR